MKKEFVESLLKDEWYVQAGNLTPLYLLPAALSGFEMQRELGVAYSAFIFESNNKTGKLFYRISDFERIYTKLFECFEKDKDYFSKLRSRYNGALLKNTEFFEKVRNTVLTQLSDDELIKFIHEGIDSETNSVGIAHVIEAVSIKSDSFLKGELGEYIPHDRLNEVFILLTTPQEKSWAQIAEDELRTISNMELSEQDSLINEYLRKYSWMSMSPAGRLTVSKEEICKEMKDLIRKGNRSITNIKEEKDALCASFRIPKKLLEKFEVLNFFCHWQDERKRNIMLAIENIDTLLKEFSRRSGIPITYLYYALKDDYNLSLFDKKEELSKRMMGVFFIAIPGEIAIYTGVDYNNMLRKIERDVSGDCELVGMSASLGKVTGKVKLCMTLEAIKEVEDGDVLVSSMTRPEYFAAMKKAVAFVTDEGGITCHAAIVAREMKKPCIIGTKIATKVLKDGDIVEVDAERGVVTILKKNQ